MYKLLIPLFVLALLAGCSGTPDVIPNDTANDTYGDNTTMMQTSSASTATSTNSSDTTMPASASSAASTKPTGPFGWDGALLSGKHTVEMRTSQGIITLEIDADAAPKAATNFITLAKAGYYNGLTFHRIIDGFMIQGGDPNGNGTGGESIFGPTFVDERNSLEMVRGVIAMANRGPNTNGSQFFIMQGDGAPWLQGKHTIFGKVVDGMKVVDSIARSPKDSRDAPRTAITYDLTVKN